VKAHKKCIVAEVDEGHMVVSFISPEVALPSQVETALREIHEAADEFNVRRLVINFTHVRHLSSAFLGKLTALHKQLSAKGVQLRLCCMSADAEHAYKLVSLQKLIPLYATEEEALKE